MNKKIIYGIMILLLMIPLVSLSSFLTLAKPTQSESLNSNTTITPPVIDGSLGYGEWQLTSSFDFTKGKLYAMNDGIRLYLMFDVLSDTQADPLLSSSPWGDYFWISFDTNHDGLISPDVDLNYNLNSQSNMRYQYYTGAGSWTGLQPSTHSSRAMGFGCFLSDGTFSFSRRGGFTPSLTCLAHRVYELAFDLAEINATPSQTIGMGFRIYSQNPSFTVDYPTDFTTNFENLLQINLGSASVPVSAEGITPSFVIPNGEKGIEITQAVQNRLNTLPLVEDKTTVARAYVKSSGGSGSGSQPVVVYLYGSRGGVDLPGSPLAQRFNAPFTTNRVALSSSANFDLPKSWDDGTITFSGLVRNSLGITDAHPSFTLSFTPKDVPTVWIIPINTGTTASPILVSNSQITSQESAMEAVYPVKDVKFVHKPWTSIGACTGCNFDTIKQKLNEYFGLLLFAWIFSGGSFELPDQIYGFTASGGGSSDPRWYESGSGLVAVGFFGSSRELTMAHEINHNLDKDTTGSWGHHVGNLDPDTWNWATGTNPNIDYSWGCGASGTDPSWPTPPNTDDIARTLAKYNVLGFDTRSPHVAVPGTYPDFMSYCQSGSTPTKWISGYRWENLFNYFATVPSSHQPESRLSLNSPDFTIPTGPTLQISGTINKDGTGSIDLVQILIGLLLPAVQNQGNSLIDLQDVNGESLSTVGFNSSFTDVEGEQTISKKFQFQIPFDQKTTKIVLKLDNNVIDSFDNQNKLPAVQFESPASQNVVSGKKEVKWTSTDADTFTLLYSPDNGESKWEPIATNIKETSFLVDFADLTPSKTAKMRVIASNGFNSTEADSPTFEVENSPPNAEIYFPLNDATFTSGELISFKGYATDPEDGILTDNQTYWYYDNTPFATGNDVLAVLPDGAHTITYGAVDSQGAFTEKTTKITVGKIVQTSDSKTSSASNTNVTTSPGFDIFEIVPLSIVAVLVVFSRRKYSRHR